MSAAEEMVLAVSENGLRQTHVVLRVPGRGGKGIAAMTAGARMVCQTVPVWRCEHVAGHQPEAPDPFSSETRNSSAHSAVRWIGTLRRRGDGRSTEEIELIERDLPQRRHGCEFTVDLDRKGLGIDLDPWRRVV